MPYNFLCQTPPGCPTPGHGLNSPGGWKPRIPLQYWDPTLIGLPILRKLKVLSRDLRAFAPGGRDEPCPSDRLSPAEDFASVASANNLRLATFQQIQEEESKKGIGEPSPR